MQITIIGAGNGGQAMAGHFAMLGHEVTLYARNLGKINRISETKKIILKGKITGEANLQRVTDDIKLALSGAELIMVTTTADAHKHVARNIAPYLQEGQSIVLNPGRTLGALEFLNEIKNLTTRQVYIAEAQSLIYAVRVESPGVADIVGVKSEVFLSALPSRHTPRVVDMLNSIYPCFSAVKSILVTGLENIGCILHPTITLFNAAAIERANEFYFYKDTTPAIARFIMSIDEERLNIGKAYGVQLHTASEWVSLAYGGSEGDTLHEKMMKNPAYSKILAPTNLQSRYIYEDIPTGLVPMKALGELAHISTPLIDAVINACQALTGNDFSIEGRTLKNLGLETATVSDITQRIDNE